ncbi:hypothetical protein HG531_004334 [Fusarium graminearum]|nr:hypothetical protein HG531_004334 [Fusarium graminearum]
MAENSMASLTELLLTTKVRNRVLDVSPCEDGLAVSNLLQCFFLAAQVGIGHDPERASGTIPNGLLIINGCLSLARLLFGPATFLEDQGTAATFGKADHLRCQYCDESREDLPALIDDQNFVHELVNAFTGLVQGDESGSVADVCHNAKRSRVIEGGRRVQSSGRVIPGHDSRLGGQCFGDRDSLSFTTRNTSSVFVADDGASCVADTKHLHEGFHDDRNISLFLDLGLVHQGKCKSLPHA